jgi:hypothetical protein
MVEGEIPEATAAAEVLFQVVQPLRMGWKFVSSAMVKELFFCPFACKLPCFVKDTAGNIQGKKGFYAGPSHRRK